MSSSKGTSPSSKRRGDPPNLKDPDYLTVGTQSLLCILALSLATYAIRAELSPLYGSTAASLYHHKIIVTAALSSPFLPHIRVRPALFLLSCALCASPAIVFKSATFTARYKEPRLGPSLTYAVTLVPIIYLGTTVLRNVVSPLDLKRLQKPSAERLVMSLGVCVGILQTQRLWSYLPSGEFLNPSNMLIVLGWLTAVSMVIPSSKTDKPITSVQQRIERNKLPLLIALCFSLLALTQPPARRLHLPYKHPSGLLRILSTTPSVTGQIVVGESLKHGFRYLRADHSLLGGVWIGDKVVKSGGDTDFSTDKDGVKLGDSIYSAFVLQEAVRLQEVQEAQKNALIIGLGVGISAQAFVKHGLSTTIIEIDPAVYNAARDYFGLDEPSSLHLEDARGWVARRAASRNETFDVVVHDCFSGGGVPEHLFTTEFWTDLKAILKPEGIVAVNFAGKIGGNTSKAILATLQNSFGSCRVFHDYHTDRSDEELLAQFINVVFFCSPSSYLAFRKASTSDYLNSYLREHVLATLPEREMNLALLRGNMSKQSESDLVLTDSKNPLGDWQEAGALEHWGLMREVLPDVFWETY